MGAMNLARRAPLWGISLVALALLMVWAPDATAAQGVAQATAAASMLKSASMIGPLGISPFFALAGFGLAGQLGVWTPPAGLELFSHPAVWVSLILLGGILQFGRSAKLTKPLAEALGTGESVFAIIATIMVMVPHLQLGASPVATAGFTSGALLLVAAVSGVTALIVVRTALDVIIWLSPFPFVDGLFQLVKLAFTLGLVLLAVLFPAAAIVVNLVILVAAIFLVRWALRTAVFGATVGYDLTVGRFRDKVPMPHDPTVHSDLGPFDAFVLDVPGHAKRRAASVEMDAGRWFLKFPRAGRGEGKTSLGDDHELRLTPGLLGLELSGPSGRVLLPPRYKHLAAQIVQQTGMHPGDRPSLLAAAVPRARRAQASAS